jgi:hypothetical protein
VTDKRERISTDPGLGPLDPPGPSTLRSIAAADDLSSISPPLPVYYEPSPLVAVSNHKTLELETVKVSENIDPRKLATQLRLGRVPSSLVPPSDSGWPPETALSSSQPPDGLGRRWRTPAALLALLGALLVLVVARAAAVRRSAGLGVAQLAGSAQPVVVAEASMAVSAPALAIAAATPLVVAAPASVAPEPVSAAAAASSPSAAPHGKHTSGSSSSQHAVKPAPQTTAREPLAAPSSSKPKRAIY